MNNIEEMRREMAQRLEWAGRENELMEQFAPEDRISASIIGHVHRDRSRINVCFRNEGYTGGLTPRQLGCIVSRFPATEESEAHGEVRMDYVACTHRYTHCADTELTVRWKHGDMDISVGLPVRDELSGFFSPQYRELRGSELDGVQKTRWNVDFRTRFMTLAPCGGKIVVYSGGYYKSLNQSWVTGLVEHCRYLYEFGEGEPSVQQATK